MSEPALVSVYDAVAKWFSDHDIELETELGWRALEKRLTAPRLVFEPGDRDAYGDFSFEAGPGASELGTIWTALTVYVQAPAAVDDERAQIVNTTRLLHAVLVALQEAISLNNFRVVSIRWLLLDEKRRANAAIALTIQVRDVLVSEVSDYLSFDAEGAFAIGMRNIAAVQHVPTDP